MLTPVPDALPHDRLVVGLVLDDGLDRPDGVQQYVLAVADRLRARGHEVHLVASTTTRTDLEHLHVLGRNATVAFNGNRLSTPLPARVSDVRALLAEVPFDVLHVCMPFSPLLAGRLVRRAGPRTAVVGTFLIHAESRTVVAATRALGLLERRTLRRFDELIALSAPAAELARRAHGRDSTVIGTPLDLDRFPAPQPAPAASPDEPVHLVFLGRLVERKGARELVAAVAELARTDAAARPWRLTLAGRGPLDAELRAAVVAAGLEDRVRMPGFVAEADKPALLASGDVVVLPSTGGESFGISVAEALACARGVVLAGDNPGYRDTMARLEDQLVAPADTAGLAATLARWVDDPAGRAAAAERQRVAVRRFAADAVTDEIEAVYRRALSARRP